MRRVLVVAGLALAVAGCATSRPWAAQAKQLMASGQCQAARNVVYANEQDPGMRAGLIGSTYSDCDRNMAEAVKQWTLSARYGNAYAQKTLAQMNQPVPSPDLARSASRGPGSALMDGYNAAGRAPSPSVDLPTRCNSYRNGNNVQTTCN
jgi:hypothetical protein